MPKPLSAETIACVKATAPVVAARATEVTKAMYARLFQDAHIKALFNHANQATGKQHHALAGAIVGYALNIENLEVLGPAVERMAQKHVGYHVLPEHYPYVAKALLGAIVEVLGEETANEAVLAAWGEAYWFLADLLKEREHAIRDAIEATDGGWNGWRAFEIAERTVESAVITSFVLRPKDGGKVLAHKPGQYLTLRLTTPDQGEIRRNYTISNAPNEAAYRISVKREESGQGGSRFLHDLAAIGTTVELTPPAGDFFLPDTPERPVVLLSGGVGLTPMVSMLETIAQKHPDLQTAFVHGALDGATHAMDDHVRALAKAHGKTSVATFYARPAANDEAGRTHDHDGLITVDWLQANTPFEAADFFLCGPRPFLKAFVGGLSRAGVASDRIHFEFFGPSDEALAV
ncbi:NO-inducible flavohemoprotein [Caulobacter flavus]|uniref:nitric oxide dioxygenase n=1 Tax=Caulobacter flavus TaxID=1679497 RepID=A0A2N5D4W3_9CAUL|nr:NO-inducible flavohemoprotein [Caulobacter flavus]AYV47142.1 NO-inducible flavohemoprotein [Caulobacter flavus]PLR21118.1 NO-inducible flavohemoprotein [Caulobacter flavus]